MGGASGPSHLRNGSMGGTTIGPPWMAGQLVTPRQSVSYSSRSPLSHHTCNFTDGLITLLLDVSVYTLEMKLDTLYLVFV